jgi:hypothetical protein
MSKTYTNRTNAIRAARTELGADAIPGIDFTVEKGAKNQYAWAPRSANGAPADAAIEAMRAEAENAETGGLASRIEAQRQKAVDEALADAEWNAADIAAEAPAEPAPKARKPRQPKAPRKPKAEAPAKAEPAPKAPRKPSKLDMIIGMVLQPGGAVMADLLAASGWTACHTTVRQECAKRGLALEVTGKGKQAVWQATKPAE